MSLQNGEEKLGMGLSKMLLITSFAGDGMELEFVDSSHYGCIQPWT